MNNVINIRAYHETYQEHVIALILAIQRAEFNIPITREDQPDLCSIPNFYQVNNGNFFVALYGERVVGTIGLLDIGLGYGALRKMFVKQEYRGKVCKTASLLLNQLLQWSNDRGFKKIYLGTTPQFLAAHRFYEKNGFQEIVMEELPSNFPIMKVDKKFYRLALVGPNGDVQG